MSAMPQNILESIRLSPGRTAVAAALGLALVLLLLRQQMNAPQAAQAGTEEATVASKPGVISPPDISRSARLLAEWRRQPPPHISRNLFVSALTRPPEAPPEAAPTAGTEEDGLFWRQLERALASRADREQYRRTLAEAAVRDASVLSVSSIVIGPDSRALVGDRLVRVGDILPGGERGSFTVVAIDSKRVILARDGQRVELVLGRPGAFLLVP